MRAIITFRTSALQLDDDWLASEVWKYDTPRVPKPRSTRRMARRRTRLLGSGLNPKP